MGHNDTVFMGLRQSLLQQMLDQERQKEAGRLQGAIAIGQGIDRNREIERESRAEREGEAERWGGVFEAMPERSDFPTAAHGVVSHARLGFAEEQKKREAEAARQAAALDLAQTRNTPGEDDLMRALAAMTSAEANKTRADKAPDEQERRDRVDAINRARVKAAGLLSTRQLSKSEYDTLIKAWELESRIYDRQQTAGAKGPGLLASEEQEDLYTGGGAGQKKVGEEVSKLGDALEQKLIPSGSKSRSGAAPEGPAPTGNVPTPEQIAGFNEEWAPRRDENGKVVESAVVTEGRRRNMISRPATKAIWEYLGSPPVK